MPVVLAGFFASHMLGIFFLTYFFALIHREKDTVLPLSQSELFLEAARNAKAPAQLLRVKGAGHSLGGKKISPSLAEVNQQAADFILKSLRK